MYWRSERCCEMYLGSVEGVRDDWRSEKCCEMYLGCVGGVRDVLEE